MKLNRAPLLLAASLLPASVLLLRAADPAASSQPTTAVQAAHDEAVKRQQLIVNANQAISDGQRFLGSGDYDQAAGRFQFALDSLTPGGVSAVSYNRAAAGLAAAKAGQAQQLAKDNKYAQANVLLQQAIILQPDNPVYPADVEELKKQQIAYEQQVRDPEGTTNNPAVTDEFRDRVAAVQKLLFQGDAYFRTGQFEKSEETYSKILILDPYNKAARDKMDHVERYRTRAAGYRHEEYEQEAIEKVNHGWAEAISPDIVAAPTVATVSTNPSNRANITRKLQSIIIDKVNFEKLDIGSVIQFLQQKSKELDPDHQGINFVLRLTSDTPVPTETGTPAAGTPPPAAPPPSTTGAAAPTGTTAPAPGVAAAPEPAQHAIHREVSITLENTPLADILGYIIQQTNLQYTVEDYAVYLRPSIDEGETLTVRTFLVPPNFFNGSSLRVTPGEAGDTTPTTVENISSNAQQSLTDKGIRFPSGASAIFLPGSSKLVVRDTPEQLDLIENLIDQLSKETPQVQIEAKIAEFNQEAVKALSFNFTAGSITPFRNFFSTALRTPDSVGTSNLGGLTPDGIDQLIQANSADSTGFAPTNPLTGGPVTENASNVLTIGAVVDGTGLGLIMDAINNLQGVSLVSAPTVTTQNNLKANIDIVQEFPYPTSFDKPKLSNNSNLGYSSGPFSGDNMGLPGGPDADGNMPVPLVLAIPPTPREFVTQDVGVSLEVKPTTYPDQRIDLDITKAQVLDFEGFIDYGVPILTRLNETIPAQDAPGTVVTEGIINQPVFNLRSMVTNLQVLDGQTAILGGLIREDTQEINDKVPVLGDIPLVGRLFQSKISQRTKKNLLIFITARLIRSNGKPMYIKTLNAEPEEEVLPEPDQQIGPGVTLPPVPEATPNS